MTDLRPMVRGPITGIQLAKLIELPNSDRLLVPSGIADVTGPLLERVSGVPSSNGQAIDETIERNTNARVAAGSPRGGVAFDDLRSQSCIILAQQEGLWTVGTRLAGAESNPELLSAAYRTTVTGTYGGGDVPAVDAIVTGAGGGSPWTARVESIGAGSFELSLYTGIVTAETALTHASGSLTLTGVTITTGIGRQTYYAATSGYKVPKAGSNGGWLNVIGVSQNSANGYRFPAAPEWYNRGFRLPKGLFVEGAVLDIDFFGVMKNTIPSTDNPIFDVVFAAGHNIFDIATLQGANLPYFSKFASPVIPTISAETMFSYNIKITNVRKDNRTQGQIMVATMRLPSSVWGGSGVSTMMFQRGTDKALAPASFPGYDFEDGEDLVNKRDLKNASVFIAVEPDQATSGEFYVNVHGFQVRLLRGTR